MTDSLAVESTNPSSTTFNLEEVVRQARLNSLTRDNPLLATLPEWFSTLRDHQRIAVREILTAYEEGAKCVVLDAPTGCLAGDTDIVINRGGKSFHSPLKDLVHKFNGGAPRGGKSWNRDIPTMAQCADDGFVRLGKVSAAWASGIKSLYTVTVGNQTIKATLTHPFLTENGYELLGNLSPGSRVGIKGARKAKDAWVKKHYRYESRLYSHPHATNKTTYARSTDGWRVPTHRLIMEATLNGVELNEYLARLTMGDIKGFVFLDPAVDAVHHKDGNSLNNDLRNLEVMPHLDHWAMEGKEHGWKNCAFPIVYEPISSIEYYGEEMTYDLEMAEEPHNFIANGFAVHNSGKTLIGETVRRLLSGAGFMDRRTSYICSSKSLQDQFIRDYPYAKVLKGRSNYATALYPDRFVAKDPLTCADCTKSPGADGTCLWCDDVSRCPYVEAKSAALSGDLAVLNTSYFLSECNGPGRFSRGGLVIADESDCLESELMSHVEVRISERRLKQYGLGVPKYVTKEESWREWAEDAHLAIRNNPPRRNTGNDLLDTRARKRHDILLAKVRGLKEGLEAGNWVYTGDKSSVAFKPVTVSSLGPDKLWQHGDKWLLMSATVISADEMLESLGWDEDSEWRLVKCPSTFKPENRKVVVWPVATMSFKTRDESIPKLVKAVTTICKDNPDDRILVHSTSYSLTNAVVEGLRFAYGVAGNGRREQCTCCVKNGLAGGSLACDSRYIFTYTSSQGKDQALEDYLATPSAIMVAPSLDRGIDLPGDHCRVQIICKVPFLSIKDKQVSARLYGTGRSGKIWYAVNAIRTIIQMTGRAVRSEEDYAVTWILDKQFVDNLYSGYRNLIPQWWKESLVWKRT